MSQGTLTAPIVSGQWSVVSSNGKATIELIHGNSLAWLDEQSAGQLNFDLVVTDPPYDSLMKWQGMGTTARMGFGAGKNAAESDKFYPVINGDQFYTALCNIDAMTKPDSHAYIMADGEYMPRILEWVRRKGEAAEMSWQYSKPLVWDKVNAGMGYHWRGTHEYIVMLEKGKRRLNDLGKQDVLRHKRVTGGYPTEKPFGLIEDLVLNSSKEGDWVLDPFMGGVRRRRCATNTTGTVSPSIFRRRPSRIHGNAWRGWRAKRSCSHEL